MSLSYFSFHASGLSREGRKEKEKEEERGKSERGGRDPRVIGRRRDGVTGGLRNTRDRHRRRIVERKNRPEDFNPVKFNYKIYRASLECLSYKGENTPVDWIGLITILELFSNFIRYRIS